jgi:hypothetical protein
MFLYGAMILHSVGAVGGRAGIPARPFPPWNHRGVGYEHLPGWGSLYLEIGNEQTSASAVGSG